MLSAILILSYHSGFENVVNGHSLEWDVVFVTSSLYSVLLIGAPILVLLFSALTLKLLIEARQISRRSRGSLRWQGIVTVVVTGTVFCLSMLPHCVFIVTNFSGASFPLYLGRRLQFLTFINSASNFFIYCFTVKSLRSFLSTRTSLVRTKFSCFNRIMPECSDSPNNTVFELQQI